MFWARPEIALASIRSALQNDDNFREFHASIFVEPNHWTDDWCGLIFYDFNDKNGIPLLDEYGKCSSAPCLHYCYDKYSSVTYPSFKRVVHYLDNLFQNPKQYPVYREICADIETVEHNVHHDRDYHLGINWTLDPNLDFLGESRAFDGIKPCPKHKRIQFRAIVSNPETINILFTVGNTLNVTEPEYEITLHPKHEITLTHICHIDDDACFSKPPINIPCKT